MRKILADPLFWLVVGLLICLCQYASGAGPPQIVVENKCPQFVVENKIVPVAKPVQSTAVSQPVHTHRCPYDGTEWAHTHASKGNVADHTCPTCGRVVWQVDHQGPPRVATPKVAIATQNVAMPQTVWQNDCPSGTCPQGSAAGRPLLRIFRR